MQRRGLAVAWMVTLGNQADVGLPEAFEAVVDDEACTGVGLCVEGLDDIERFAAAAAAARRRDLPVVALKLGASERAEAIAITHTASLVGDDAAYDALFRRLGIRRVHTVPELLDTLAVLCVLGPLAGGRLVSLSCSGGEAALVGDRSRGRDLSFPPFAPDHADRVAAALDDRVAVTNPLDYQTFIWGDEARLAGCFGTVLGAGGIGAGAKPFDAALLVLDFPAEGLDRSRWWPTLRAFAGACVASGTPGVVAASMAENLPEEARARAAELGLAACGDIDTALGALESAAAWQSSGSGTRPPDSLVPPADSRRAGSRRSSPWSPSVSSSTSCDRGAGSSGATGTKPHRHRERTYGSGVTGEAAAPVAQLREHEAKQRLAAAGIDVPAGFVVPVAEAAAAAERVGCPVVVKTPAGTHKSDTGGVVVGVSAPAEAEAAARCLAAAPGESVLVEAFVGDAVAELLVNARSAPPVGMLLTLGAGGTLAELLDNTASLLLPAAPDDVLEALRSLRIWPLLAGHRGSPAGAVDAVVEAVAALGALVCDDRSIIEIEINPLIVTPHAAVAVDALMLVAESPSP